MITVTNSEYLTVARTIQASDSGGDPLSLSFENGDIDEAFTIEETGLRKEFGAGLAVRLSVPDSIMVILTDSMYYTHSFNLFV